MIADRSAAGPGQAGEIVLERGRSVRRAVIELTSVREPVLYGIRQSRGDTAR
jgi:hypothetical protein